RGGRSRSGGRTAWSRRSSSWARCWQRWVRSWWAADGASAPRGQVDGQRHPEQARRGHQQHPAEPAQRQQLQQGECRGDGTELHRRAAPDRAERDAGHGADQLGDGGEQARQGCDSDGGPDTKPVRRGAHSAILSLAAAPDGRDGVPRTGGRDGPGRGIGLPPVALTIGIAGLPNVGKSTLFNALTRATVLAANYPFATIEPNVGVVPLPDPRLQVLADVFGSERIVPATVSF